MISVVQRRTFLRAAGAASAGVALGEAGRLFAQTPAHVPAPLPTIGRRRIFEITTRVEIMKPSGPTRVWLPTPFPMTPYQETLGDTYHLGEDGRSVMAENEDVDMLVAEWPAGPQPLLT